MPDRSAEVERDLLEQYGYTRRPGQSTSRLVVPAALIQEAHDSCPEGDAKALLRRVLLKAPISEDR